MGRSNKKKSFSLLLAAVMLFSLMAGCANEQGAETPSTSPSASTPVESQPVGTMPAELEELGSGDVKWSEEKTADGWIRVTNDGGATLGYMPDSGIKLLQSDGYAFKDMNQNGKLDVYEDWRQDADTRAEALTAMMTVDEQLPLMILTEYDTGYQPGSLDDYVTGFMDIGVRDICEPFQFKNVAAAVEYSNMLQAYVEGDTYGIPIDLHAELGSSVLTTFVSNIGFGASFDPDLIEEYARITSAECRAIGVTTVMSPQIDLATEPRWSRIAGTFGEDPQLSSDLARAVTNGLQSTYDENGNDLGWGADSINTLVKHYPGDGSAEGGREAHSATGAYNVYPGDNFYTSTLPFAATLDLPGLTRSASGIMPSYSIAIGSDGEAFDDEPVASSFSHFKLTEVLREELGFDGIISSDFALIESSGASRPWGVEDKTPAERRYLALEAGLDQFGGENLTESLTSLREAYDMGVEEHGEEYMQERIAGSAFRILRARFRIGLFENPYLVTEESEAKIGTESANDISEQSVRASVVMIKNSGDLIHASTGDSEKPTVYIPMVYTPASFSMWGATKASWSIPVDVNIYGQYFNIVTDSISPTLTGEADENGNPTVSMDDIIRATDQELAACDFAFVKISNPTDANSGYDAATETYLPISLQYRPYTANSQYVRTKSLGGSQIEVSIESPYGAQTVYETEDRSYYGKSTTSSNESDLDTVLYAASKVGKVIVSVSCNKPMIFSEFEGEVDAILVDFDANDTFNSSNSSALAETICRIITGEEEPSGLLPFQMPANMETVEAQYEDVPRDMECHVDSEGNTYDFAFGLNWSGVISDERTAQYDVPPLEG